MTTFILTIALLFTSQLTSQLTSPTAPRETDVVKQIASRYNARVEVRLWDATRVDMLSDDTAWEVDWSHKWAEGIGQALYYAAVTRKRPGLVLLVRDMDRDRRYVYRAQTVCAKHGIELRIEVLRKDANGAYAVEDAAPAR